MVPMPLAIHIRPCFTYRHKRCFARRRVCTTAAIRQAERTQEAADLLHDVQVQGLHRSPSCAGVGGALFEEVDGLA